MNMHIEKSTKCKEALLVQAVWQKWRFQCLIEHSTSYQF